MEIIGTEGTLGWDYASGGVRLYRSEEKEWQTFSIPEDFERNDMFLAEMSHFIDLVRGNPYPMCSLTDGIRALNLALAVKKSSQEKIIIRLNELSNGDA